MEDITTGDNPNEPRTFTGVNPNNDERIVGKDLPHPVPNKITDLIQQAREEERKEMVDKIRKWHKENEYSCVAMGEGQECCEKSIINLIQGGDNSVENKS